MSAHGRGTKEEQQDPGLAGWRCLCPALPRGPGCPLRTLTWATSMVPFTSMMPRASRWSKTVPTPSHHSPGTFLLKFSTNHTCSTQWLFTNCTHLLARWHFWYTNYFILNISFPLSAISCVQTVWPPYDDCFMEEIWQQKAAKVFRLLCHNNLHQESTNFLCKGPDSQFFWLCGPRSLCWNYSILPLLAKSNKRQCVNKRVWLCANQTLFTKPVLFTKLYLQNT